MMSSDVRRTRAATGSWTHRVPIVGLALGLCLSAPAAAFDLQGHRGARGLAPENTLPAFAVALSLGVDTLELDTGLTKDGTVVIHHDRTLNPAITRGPDGEFLSARGPAVRALSLAELERYDVGALKPGTDYAKAFPEQKPAPGARVPTLAELAALVRKAGNDTVRFNVETKLSPLAPDETADPETFVSALIAALRAEGVAARAAIQSFDWRTLRIAQRLAPEIPTVYLTNESGNNPNIVRGKGASAWTAGLSIDDHGGSIPRLIKAAGGRVWSPNFRNVTAEALAEAKALGIAVIVWTVNERAEMTRMIELGVDGIITDRPDILRAAMAEKAMPLPRSTPVTP